MSREVQLAFPFEYVPDVVDASWQRALDAMVFLAFEQRRLGCDPRNRTGTAVFFTSASRGYGRGVVRPDRG